jgi:hypothetical protein
MFNEDRNMAKILQFRPSGTFPTTPRASKPEPRRKEPIVLSIMPEQPFPVGHRDLRPLLQRDGLILLSWALWEDWYANDTLLRRYIVTWVSSQGRASHYATKPIPEEELAEACPQRRGDAFFYRGAYGSRFDLMDYGNREIADYLYLAAPFDLDKGTIPGYIRVLKALGSTVDFDTVFSLAQDRAKKSQARAYLEAQVL